jgi:hypothetical protein
MKWRGYAIFIVYMVGLMGMALNLHTRWFWFWYGGLIGDVVGFGAIVLLKGLDKL